MAGCPGILREGGHPLGWILGGRKARDELPRRHSFQFADLLDRQTVHPGTELGQLVEKHDGLDQCSYQRAHERELLQNFWTWASASFVRGMVRHGQESIVAFVNKDAEGPRALSKSVLAQCEIPSIGQMSLFARSWTPHVVVVDLKGTCNVTSPFLQRRLVSPKHVGLPFKVFGGPNYWGHQVVMCRLLGI